jgi:hypothetical protein
MVSSCLSLGRSRQDSCIVISKQTSNSSAPSFNTDEYLGLKSPIMSSLHELLHRQRPGLWQRFWAQPYVFLSRTLYRWQNPILAIPLRSPVAIVCISDTHNAQIMVPDGDNLYMLVISHNLGLSRNFRTHLAGYTPCLILSKS